MKLLELGDGTKIKSLEWKSRAFAKLLFQKYPHWLRFSKARREGEPGMYDIYLEVEVPAEHPTVQTPFRIKVDAYEVLVWWGNYWHEHYYPMWEGDTWESTYDKALQFIDDLFAEQVCMISTLRMKDQLNLQTLISSDKAIDYIPEPDTKIEIISWRGTFDQGL